MDLRHSKAFFLKMCNGCPYRNEPCEPFPIFAALHRPRRMKRMCMDSFVFHCLDCKKPLWPMRLLRSGKCLFKDNTSVLTLLMINTHTDLGPLFSSSLLKTTSSRHPPCNTNVHFVKLLQAVFLFPHIVPTPPKFPRIC